MEEGPQGGLLGVDEILEEMTQSLMQAADKQLAKTGDGSAANEQGLQLCNIEIPHVRKTFHYTSIGHSGL